MDISLTPNIERILRNKVAEGIYNSLNEAINVTLGIALNGSCISQEELDKLKQAARLEAYASYSEFVRRTALLEASKIIEDNRKKEND